MNVGTQFPSPNDPIHRAAAAFKRDFQGVLRGLAVAAGARDPDALTEQLAILVDGATSVFYVAGDETAALAARRTAEALLAAQGVEERMSTAGSVA